MEHRIYIVGMGPGREDMMTGEAVRALEQADVIVGYTVYLDLLGSRFRNKEMISTPMRREEERCRICFEEARKGKRVALVCSGDAGIYGMASLMYEIGREYPDTAVLGAPLNHDFCTVSLSDLLTPWEVIERRLEGAARGDFVIVLYNPSSRRRRDYLRQACSILLRTIEGSRVCGYVENIGRDGTRAEVCTLEELKDREVNMFTTVFVGNSDSFILNGKLITRRGYGIERNIDFCGNH